MDPTLMTIMAFVLVILMLVFPFAYAMNKRANMHEERKLELKARIEEARAQQVREERRSDDLLEDRVRVLERIATDRGADLAAQIEDLRGGRAGQREDVQ